MVLAKFNKNQLSKHLLLVNYRCLPRVNNAVAFLPGLSGPSATGSDRIALSIDLDKKCAVLGFSAFYIVEPIGAKLNVTQVAGWVV